MFHEESEALESYLRSIKESRGLPSQKELDCLERASMWEKLMGFCEELKSAGGGAC